MYTPKEVAFSTETHKISEGLSAMIDELVEEKTAHESDFNYFKNYPSDTTIFIDVGSNIGNSVVSITNTCGSARIFGFEPNELLLPFLQRAQSYNDHYQFRLAGLSEYSGNFELIIPIVDNNLIVGESSTSLDHFSEAVVSNRLRSYSSSSEFQITKVICKLERLDDQQHIFEAAGNSERRVIKIDTEGTELSVLLGGLSFIQKYRPTIMIEDGSRDEIASLLSQLGYSQYVYDDQSNALFDKHGRDSLNSFFVYRGL